MTEAIKDRSYGVIPIFYRGAQEPLVLILKQRAGHWSLPKGHLEKHEKPIEAAGRELAEETKIKDIAIKTSPVFKQNYVFKEKGILYTKEVMYYLGETKSLKVTVDGREIVNYLWVPLTQLQDLLTVDGKPNEAISQLLEFLLP